MILAAIFAVPDQMTGFGERLRPSSTAVVVLLEEILARARRLGILANGRHKVVSART